jgi:predicted nucleic acid-binding protein
MNLFDTNVLLDIATGDPIWLPWSEQQFRTAAVHGPIFINPIIYAELAPAFASAADLDRWLDPAVFQRLPLPYPAGWLAAQAFLKYQRSGGTQTSSLPDFYIGAHAEIEQWTQVTRGGAGAGVGGRWDSTTAVRPRIICSAPLTLIVSTHADRGTGFPHYR